MSIGHPTTDITLAHAPAPHNHQLHDDNCRLILSYDKIKKHAHEISTLLDGTEAHVTFINTNKGDGFLISNTEISSTPTFILNDVSLQLNHWGAPTNVLNRYSRKLRKKADISKALLDLESTSPSEESLLLRDTAYNVAKAIDLTALLSHIAKKLYWLEEHSFPNNRPRKYWPAWFHKYNHVRLHEITCWGCGRTPADINTLVNPVWTVLHISDTENPWSHGDKNIPPTENEQFISCPSCSGTVDFDSDEYAHHKTCLYIVDPLQLRFQPIEDRLEGQFINKNWLESLPITGPLHTRMHKYDRNNEENNKENMLRIRSKRAKTSN